MQIRLSATSIRDFLACSQKYRLRYIAALEPDQDAEALRVGGAWAKAHEVYDEWMVGSPEATIEGAMREALYKLDKIYFTIPPGYDAQEWEAEREMLKQAFVVYHDVYTEPLSVIETEARHEFPLWNPLTEMPMPLSQVICVVKLDKLVHDSISSLPAVFEMKTTSREIAPGSDYWTALRLDIQVSFYAKWATLTHGNIAPTIYDVFRRPLLRLKKGETVTEYANRVEEKLRANPQEHFQRHKIVRTDKDLEMFDRELFNVYEAMRAMIQRDGWVSNTSQCVSFMGNCPYKNICHRDGAERTVRENLIPIGFRKREIK